MKQAEQRSDMKTSNARDYAKPEYKLLDERPAQGKSLRERHPAGVARPLEPAKDRRDTTVPTL
jgi:hypothetical protein